MNNNNKMNNEISNHIPEETVPVINYEKLFKLLEGPVKTERQLEVLNKFIRVINTKNLAEEDISSLPRIIHDCIKKFNEGIYGFEQVLEDIVVFVSHGLINDKQKDFQDYAPMILEEMGLVGWHEKFNKLLTKLYLTLLSSEEAEFYKNVFVTTPKSLGNLALAMRWNEDIAQQDSLLFFIQEFSEIPKFSECTEYACTPLLEAFFPIREIKTLKLLDILHILLASNHTYKMKQIVEEEKNIEVFDKVLSAVLEENGKVIDRDIRNDSFLIALQLFKSIENKETCIQLKIADKFAYLAVDAKKQLDFQEREDEIFWEILLNLVIVCAEDQLISKSTYKEIIPEWMKFMNPSITGGFFKKFNKRVVDFSVHSYLDIIQTSMEDIQDLITNQSYLLILIHLLKYYSPYEKDELKIKSQLVPLLQEILVKKLELIPFAVDNHLLTLLHDILKQRDLSPVLRVECYMLISVLCRSSPKMKMRALASGTLDVLMAELSLSEQIDFKSTISFLKIFSFKSGNKAEEVKVLFSVVHGIWNLVCQVDENEKVFLNKEGVFKLLDLLIAEKCRDLKRHILGCLIDLMDNSRTIKHIDCWRYTNTNQNISEILVDLWRSEEKLLNIARESSGLIKEFGRPLDEKLRFTSDSPDPIDEIQDNLRIKIYLFMLKFGFKNVREMVCLNDQIVVAMISRYHDFKLSEIWDQIAYDLKSQGVRPTTPDAELMAVVKKSVIQKSKQVHHEQQVLYEKFRDIQSHEEKEFYREISHRLPSLSRVG